MPQFNALIIKDIRKETPECVSISFDIPEHLKEQYRFRAGQNITLKFKWEGEELRRSYSICSSPFDNELRVAVKKINDGKFSGLANGTLKIGDKIDVLPPGGRFGPKQLISANTTSSYNSSPDDQPAKRLNYLAFAVGSGITPVISIIKTTLAAEPDSTFTLVYGNRNRGSIIFREQLEGMKNRYMHRFVLHHILSREKTETLVNHGRIDSQKCDELSRGLIDVSSMDDIFLCGPEQMIFGVREWLLQQSVTPTKIHFELFTVPGQQTVAGNNTPDTSTQKNSKVSIKLDGVMIAFDHPFDGMSILEGALSQGADLPFSCKGGVCATCKARLVKGEVEMENNYALEAEELEAGFILTCQSHPRTSEVMIDFDQR